MWCFSKGGLWKTLSLCSYFSVYYRCHPMSLPRDLSCFFSSSKMEFHCLDVAQFNHSSVERYLDYLHLFAFTSYAAINACVCTSFGRSMHNLFSIVYTSPRKRWICRKCFELFWSAAYIFGLKVVKAGSQNSLQFDIDPLQKVQCLTLSLEEYFSGPSPENGGRE